MHCYNIKIIMKLCDAHNDFLTYFKTFKEKINYVKKLKNIKYLCCAVFTTENNINISDLIKLKNELYILQTYTKTKLLFTIEDIGFVDNVEKLNQLIKLKPFAVTLCWNYKNKLCSGTLGKGGITKWGKFVVKVLENNNILIDTAHMNKQSFKNFVGVTTKPIFNSHSNIYSLHKHKRNLTNKQIKAIVDSGGYLGLTIYPNFISKKVVTSFDVAKQIDYLIKNLGYRNFGFGTDFFGVNILPQNINNYFNLNNVKNDLINMGYKNKIIKYIFYKNFMCLKK